MTKTDIFDVVVAKTGFTKNKSVDYVESVFEIMKSTLANGENLNLSGFGNFTEKRTKESLLESSWSF